MPCQYPPGDPRRDTCTLVQTYDPAFNLSSPCLWCVERRAIDAQFAQNGMQMLVDNEIQRRRQAMAQQEEALFNARSTQSSKQMLVGKEIHRRWLAVLQQEELSINAHFKQFGMQTLVGQEIRRRRQVIAEREAHITLRQLQKRQEESTRRRHLQRQQYIPNVLPQQHSAQQRRYPVTSRQESSRAGRVSGREGFERLGCKNNLSWCELSELLADLALLTMLDKIGNRLVSRKRFLPTRFHD